MGERHSIRLIGLLGITFPKVSPPGSSKQESTALTCAPRGDASGNRKEHRTWESFKTTQSISTCMSAVVTEVKIFLGTHGIRKIQEMAEPVYRECVTWAMVDNDTALLFNTKGNKSTLLKILKLALMIHCFLCIAPIQQALGRQVVCLLNPPNSVSLYRLPNKAQPSLENSDITL